MQNIKVTPVHARKPTAITRQLALASAHRTGVTTTDSQASNTSTHVEYMHVHVDQPKCSRVMFAASLQGKLKATHRQMISAWLVKLQL